MIVEGKKTIHRPRRMFTKYLMDIYHYLEKKIEFLYE